MPTVVTLAPTQPAQRAAARGVGSMVVHECRDSRGAVHRQRMALGSVRGVYYLDAICNRCGAHLIWVDEDAPDLEEYEKARHK